MESRFFCHTTEKLPGWEKLNAQTVECPTTCKGMLKSAPQERDPPMSTHESTTTTQDNLTKHTQTTTLLALCGHVTLDVTASSPVHWGPKGKAVEPERITRRPQVDHKQEVSRQAWWRSTVTITKTTCDGRRPKN